MLDPNSGISLSLTSRHVAMKILSADSYDGNKDTFELDILRYMASKTSPTLTLGSDSNRILGLLDEF
ncbi:hypothetical protein F5Y05DRAFT_364485 [Hypoxylon sp. FL0543]|nr:hypothetical protein F5Y05DRAFT_364485 [Hypoxylon sp. FL0543]